MTYSELQVTTHFSFLRGASSCEQLFATAALMGMPALGIVDRNSVAGVVRGLYAAEQLKKTHDLTIRSIPGCRLDLVDGTSLLVWPEDRAGWSRLTRLLSLGKSRADTRHGEKGQCFLHWEDVADHADGLVAALVPGRDQPDARDLNWMADLFPRRGHVCLTHYRRPGDVLRLNELAGRAAHFGLQTLATGDVLYAEPDDRLLQDVLTAIREKCTIDQLGFRRERHAGRYLMPPEDVARRYRRHPEALHAVEAIVERCSFTLRELAYQYPDEVVMNGRTPPPGIGAADAQCAERPLRRQPTGTLFPSAEARAGAGRRQGI